MENRRTWLISLSLFAPISPLAELFPTRRDGLPVRRWFCNTLGISGLQAWNRPLVPQPVPLFEQAKLEILP